MLYTYGDNRISKGARENLEKFGRVVTTLLLVWSVKSTVSYAIDLSKGDISSTDQKYRKEMTPANLYGLPNNNDAFDHRPPSPRVSVLKPYIHTIFRFCSM